MSELCRLRRSERYGACDDELNVFQAVEWETRGRLPPGAAAEARKGVPAKSADFVGKRRGKEAKRGFCRKAETERSGFRPDERSKYYDDENGERSLPCCPYSLKREIT